MPEKASEINMIELLLKISNDVSSIKTDMTNFKEAQRVEKENTAKDIQDTREDFKRELEELESRLSGRINGLQTIQNNLVGDIDVLKHAEDSKDAKKWRTIVAFLLTALGGMFVAKLPEIIRMVLIIIAKS